MAEAERLLKPFRLRYPRVSGNKDCLFAEKKNHFRFSVCHSDANVASPADVISIATYYLQQIILSEKLIAETHFQVQMKVYLFYYVL